MWKVDLGLRISGFPENDCERNKGLLSACFVAFVFKFRALGLLIFGNFFLVCWLDKLLICNLTAREEF